jgi:hypothetical protein
MSEDRLAGLARLREPFPDHQVNKLPKPNSKDSKRARCADCGGYHGLPAVHLSYVGHAALTDRFLQVDPEWTWEPMALDDRRLPAFDANGGLWIRLTILGVTRIGYGDAEGKRGGNAIKESIGDALRNAGMRFGAALDLWHKGDLHDAGEQRGTAEPIDQADPEPVDPEPVDPEPVDPAVAARIELSELITRLGIAPGEAAERFGLDGHGDLGRSTDVAAIKALTAHYAELGGEP